MVDTCPLGTAALLRRCEEVVRLSTTLAVESSDYATLALTLLKDLEEYKGVEGG